MTMSKIAALAAAALTLSALPALPAAGSLDQTHQRVWGQSGKSAPGYRPLTTTSCKSVSPIHIAGKTPVPMHAQTRAACKEQLAMKDAKEVQRD